MVTQLHDDDGAETAAMRGAMDDSLREHQDRKALAAQRPLHAQPVAQLQEHFSTSVLLQEVRAAAASVLPAAVDYWVTMDCAVAWGAAVEPGQRAA